MSWLSKALGGNTLKIGAALAAGYFGKEYLFGATSPSQGYLPTGELVSGKYTSGNLASSVLNKFDITPFAQTSFGQSAVGKAITGVGSFLSIGDEREDPSLFSQLLASQFKQPGDPRMNPLPGGVRSDLAFQAGRAQQIQLGNSGALNAALGRSDLQQYLAKQVAMMRLPPVSALPTASSISSGVSTTKGQRRSYAKMTTGTT
tara:strand:+ start:338 stop:946 length:609 start_codon:yes stop_codon:yes gene_type:complete